MMLFLTKKRRQTRRARLWQLEGRLDGTGAEGFIVTYRVVSATRAHAHVEIFVVHVAVLHPFVDHIHKPTPCSVPQQPTVNCSHNLGRLGQVPRPFACRRLCVRECAHVECVSVSHAVCVCEYA